MEVFDAFLAAQSEQTIVAFCVAIGLSILCVIFSKIIDRADPLKRPSGLMLFLEMYYQVITNLVTSIYRGQMKMMVPYGGFLLLYIISMNYIGLFIPVDGPATDYNVPLGLVSITLVLIHVTNVRYNGMKSYLLEYFEPFPVMLPLNLMDIIAKPLSMSMRLFGNVLSGSLILMIFAQFTGYIQKMILSPIFPDASAEPSLNVIGAIMSAPFHFYLDVFAGGIQAFVFTLLTLIFVSLSIDFDKVEGES